MSEEYYAKGKSCICIVWTLRKLLDRVPRKVLEWAMRKNRIPEVPAKTVMSLYEGAKTIVIVHCELSQEHKVKVWMHHGSVLSPFLFAVMVDVAREGALSELLYADDLVLMNETIKGLNNKFLYCKEAFESKGLKVNLGKTKVMVSGSIIKDGMSKSNVDPCGVCSLRVNSNPVLCVQCGKWIHGRWSGVNRVTAKSPRNLKCKKCKGNIGEAVEQKEMLCDEVKTVRKSHILVTG